MVIIGTFILAVSVEFFILPYNILSGGVAGIAVALEPVLHLNKTLTANLITLILFFIGWSVLGKEFALNTALSSVLYPVFTTLLSFYHVEFEIPVVLASFYAGLLGGVGIAIVMRGGASTGGMDVPPLILHKLSGAPVSTLVVITDSLTIVLGAITYNWSAVLIGLVSVFASGVAISKVLEAGNGSPGKSVQIISDAWEEINTNILNELDRGTTVIEGQGGYSGETKKVLLVVVSHRQYNRLLQIIRETDPLAFVITTDASDMHGEGFTYSSPNI